MSFKAAAVHAAPVYMDKDASITKAIGIIQDAGKQDIKLLVFPEAFIPGYPHFVFAYPPFRYMALIAQYAEQSMYLFDRTDPSQPSADLQRIQSACRESSVTIVLGISERSGFSTSTMFNTQVYISSDGTFLGAHRKLVPTFAERAVWAQGSGTTLRCWDVPHPTATKTGTTYRLGGLVCAENTMPGSKYALALAGEQVHAASYPAMKAYRPMKDTYEDRLRTVSKSIAFESASVVITASTIVNQEQLAWVEEKLGKDHDMILCEGSGWSGVVDPGQGVMAEETEMEEHLVAATVTLERGPVLKVINDPAGHFRRPEVLKLTVNRDPLWDDDEMVATGGSKQKRVYDSSNDCAIGKL